MAHQLSAAQAKSRLADCLRKAERGESVIITRRSRPVAALVAVDRVTLPKSKGSRASLGLVGLAGGWKGSEDLVASRTRRYEATCTALRRPNARWPSSSQSCAVERSLTGVTGRLSRRSSAVDERARVGDDDHRDSSVVTSFFRSSTE
jgi:prevent-host-death family protein